MDRRPLGAAMVAAGLLVFGQTVAAAAPINVLASGALDSGGPPADGSDPSRKQECLTIGDIENTDQLNKQLWDWLRQSWNRLPLEFHTPCLTAPDDPTSEDGGGSFGRNGFAPGGSWGGAVGQGVSGMPHHSDGSPAFSAAFSADDDQDFFSDNFFGPLDDPTDLFDGGSPFIADGDEVIGNPQFLVSTAIDRENPSGDGDAPIPRLTILANQEATPVPEPATLWLTATGLAGAWRCRRKIRR